MKRLIPLILAVILILPVTTQKGGENMANYLYNGVELPDINTVWTDKEKYPYAVITSYAYEENRYHLLLGKSPFVAHNTTEFKTLDGYTAYRSLTGDTAWTFMQSDNGAYYCGGNSEPLAWTSHDILNADGSVHLAASDPADPNASSNDHVKHLSGDGMALYNGVMLPNIDSVWSDELKAQYPYAHISVEDNGDLGVLYYLYFTNSVPLYNGSGYKISGNYYNFVCTYDQTIIDAFVSMGVPAFPIGSWADFGAKGAVDGTFGDPVIWTSNDILNTDGSTYLSASVPIPLDGMNVITWDGDTTGLVSVSDEDASGMNYTWYKVSGHILTAEDFVDGVVVRKGSDGTLTAMFIPSDYIFASENLCTAGFVVISNNTPNTSVAELPQGTFDATLPETGLYFLQDYTGDYVSLFAYPASPSGFTITTYDPITTNFAAVGWRRLSYHTTGELAGQWTYDDFFTTPSTGGNFLKNIIQCSREKLYYNGAEVWPNPDQSAITAEEVTT